jgi:hypothetical protein
MMRIRISRLRGQAAGGQTAPASSTRDAASFLGVLSGEGRPSEGTTHWVHAIAVRGQSKAGAPGISGTATGTTCNRALYEGMAATRSAWGWQRTTGPRLVSWSEAWLGGSGTPEPEAQHPINFFGAIAGLTDRAPQARESPCQPIQE